MTSSRPLGNAPACIYVGEMGCNCVYDAIKSFWPKPSLPTVCPQVRRKAGMGSALGNVQSVIWCVHVCTLYMLS